MTNTTSRAPLAPLDTIPAEVLERIVALLPLRDLVAANATSRLFRGAPGGRSAVEHALRARARDRGHERALQTTTALLPTRTWIEELLARECVLSLARAHAGAVACAESGSAIVGADGGLYTCGEEETRHGYGQPAALGHSKHAGDAPVLVPTRVASLAAVRICAVSAGPEHLLALSEAGAVYGCGENGRGQLGLGDTRRRRAFTALDSLRDEVVVCIAAGAWHGVALAAAGCAYSWGDNGRGQLGHGDTTSRLEPARIGALEGVRVGGASAGEAHTVLLATAGAVYTCGMSRYGRLGHGTADDQDTPKRVEALAAVRAAHVSAGALHSLVVDAAGGVHSFGLNRSRCLGHGAEIPGMVQPVPKRIRALAGVRAVRAFAGAEGSAVLGADGTVRMLGDGHPVYSTRLYKLVPATTLALAPVASCAIGCHHALFVTADGGVHSCGVPSGSLGYGRSLADDDHEGSGDIEPPRRIEQPAARVDRIHAAAG